MEIKQCSKCKQEKPVSEFGKNPKMISGYGSHCKQCKRDYSKNYRKTSAGIYQQLKGQISFSYKHTNIRDKRGYLRYPRKELLCTQEEFVEWYDAQPKVCVYCGIREEELGLVPDTYNRNITRLSVDAVDNNKGYFVGNMVLSCGRCNMTKSDFFTYSEMIEIGKIVKIHWV